MNKFTIIIPARMHSGRLPHKMTLNVGGLPLIVRTAKQALKSDASKVIVATDHNQIIETCQQHGIEAMLTSVEHKSGTDRISEVVTKLNCNDDEIIINVQGDEPLIEVKLINQLAKFIHFQQSEIATVAHKIEDEDEVFNPNIVKVVLDKFNHALYFSRAPIPFYRDGFIDRKNFQLPKALNILRHVGIYAYSVRFLKHYCQMPLSNLEHIESLEQLRAMYNGHKISVLVSDIIPHHGIDTLEDLQRVRQTLAQGEEILV